MNKIIRDCNMCFEGNCPATLYTMWLREAGGLLLKLNNGWAGANFAKPWDEWTACVRNNKCESAEAGTSSVSEEQKIAVGVSLTQWGWAGGGTYNFRWCYIYILSHIMIINVRTVFISLARCLELVWFCITWSLRDPFCSVFQSHVLGSLWWEKLPVTCIDLKICQRGYQHLETLEQIFWKTWIFV